MLIITNSFMMKLLLLICLINICISQYSEKLILNGSISFIDWGAVIVPLSSSTNGSYFMQNITSNLYVTNVYTKAMNLSNFFSWGLIVGGQYVSQQTCTDSCNGSIKNMPYYYNNKYLFDAFIINNTLFYIEMKGETTANYTFSFDYFYHSNLLESETDILLESNELSKSSHLQSFLNLI